LKKELGFFHLEINGVTGEVGAEESMGVTCKVINKWQNAIHGAACCGDFMPPQIGDRFCKHPIDYKHDEPLHHHLLIGI
jgi:hypothetical protein